LESELRQLKQTEPNVSITVLDNVDTPTETITISVVEYVALPENIVDDLVQEAQRRSPRDERLHAFIDKPRPVDSVVARMVVLDPSLKYQPPTIDDVRAYEEHHYPEWTASIRTFFADLHNRLAAPHRYATCAVVLKNEGSRPATSVMVTFKALGGILLTPDPPDDTSLWFPDPPHPPKGSYVRNKTGLEHLLAGTPRHNFSMPIRSNRPQQTIHIGSMKITVTNQRPSGGCRASSSVMAPMRNDWRSE
jgi:hypothetical protein